MALKPVVPVASVSSGIGSVTCSLTVPGTEGMMSIAVGLAAAVIVVVGASHVDVERAWHRLVEGRR